MFPITDITPNDNKFSMLTRIPIRKENLSKLEILDEEDIASLLKGIPVQIDNILFELKEESETDES